FSTRPSAVRLFRMGETAEETSRTRNDVAKFIRPLEVGGGTAIFTSVQQALMELAQERSRNSEKRYYTVVLMKEGEKNEGLTLARFRNWYSGQGQGAGGIRVFPILFGEGNPKELNELAELTGGRVFDSRSKALASVFKEIRGYQ